MSCSRRGPRSGLRLGQVLTSIIGLSLVAASVGCSGGGSSGGGRPAGAGSGGGSTGGGGTTTGFAAVDVTPADGATNVPVGTAISVTFNQDVDPTTVIPANVTVARDTGPVAGSLGIDPGNPARVIFTPAQPLADDRPHLIRVEPDLASVSGDLLGNVFLTTFRTGTVATPAGQITAGAARVDATPPIGVPLAGFGGATRRRLLPDINPFDYHTLFNPSTGIMDPIYARTVIIDDGTDQVAIVTIDAIATTRRSVVSAIAKANARGVPLTEDQVMVCSSHTHGGPGALTRLRFWAFGAADLYVDRVFEGFTDAIAESIVQAWNDMGPARIGSDMGQLTGVTKNRRHDESPNIGPQDIDPDLGIIRVDRLDGTPVATVWNYAIHGIGYGASNMEYTADIMGAVSANVENDIGGVALFANGSEGDITPEHRGANEVPIGARIIADAIIATRSTISPTAVADVANASEVVPFGDAQIDLTLSRAGTMIPRQLNFLNILVGFGFNPGFVITLGDDWLENEFRFQAIRIDNDVIASVPGEAIHHLGFQIKDDARALGYRNPFVFNLANGHMSYIATEPEYHIGGYEGIATFFGPRTGPNVRAACEAMMQRVR